MWIAEKRFTFKECEDEVIQKGYFTKHPYWKSQNCLIDGNLKVKNVKPKTNPKYLTFYFQIRKIPHNHIYKVAKIAKKKYPFSTFFLSSIYTYTYKSMVFAEICVGNTKSYCDENIQVDWWKILPTRGCLKGYLVKHQFSLSYL